MKSFKEATEPPQIQERTEDEQNPKREQKRQWSKVQHLRRRQGHGGHDQDVCKARMVPPKDTGGREHPIDHMSTVLEEAHLQRVIVVQGYARGWKNTPRSLREPS
jgi:hypothetical protein